MRCEQLLNEIKKFERKNNGRCKKILIHPMEFRELADDPRASNLLEAHYNKTFFCGIPIKRTIDVQKVEFRTQKCID